MTAQNTENNEKHFILYMRHKPLIVCKTCPTQKTEKAFDVSLLFLVEMAEEKEGQRTTRGSLYELRINNIICQ
jgi:hypothetical protein